MLALSIISVVIANTTVDPNTIYIIIGVVVLLFIILASSSGSGVKTGKKFCLYCGGRVNYPVRLNSPKVPLNSPSSKNAFSKGSRFNNPTFSNPSKSPNLRINRGIGNDPIITGTGKMLCPHCRSQL